MFVSFFFTQTTESDKIDADSVDHSQNPITDATATTSFAAVGNFYRQFSKKKNKKKEKKTTTTVVATVQQLQECPEEFTASASSLTSSVDLRPTAVVDLRVRPPVTADPVEAPPWLVADNFVIEQVAREHVSVVLEPDYAEMVPVAPQDDFDDGSPAAASVAAPLSHSMTTVKRHPDARVVSIFLFYFYFF